jgi:hypothetical protein
MGSTPLEHLPLVNAVLKGDVMDPDALWQMILENLRILNEDPQNRDERDNVVSNLQDLIDWLRKGGYPPTIE